MMANLDDNKAKLRELVEEIKKTIVEAIDKFPASFKRLIAFAAKEIDSTFKAERQRVLAVFLFSRVIIPPLLNPLQYSLLKGTFCYAPFPMQTLPVLLLYLQLSNGRQMQQEQVFCSQKSCPT
jgi:hypothetical protein